MPKRLCACGCGQPVTGSARRIYANPPRCKQRVYRRRQEAAAGQLFGGLGRRDLRAARARRPRRPNGARPALSDGAAALAKRLS